jgi:hypothetical protein
MYMKHHWAKAQNITEGINEMDPPLCGSTVIGHNAVRETDQQSTTRRTSP